MSATGRSWKATLLVLTFSLALTGAARPQDRSSRGHFQVANPPNLRDDYAGAIGICGEPFANTMGPPSFWRAEEASLRAPSWNKSSFADGVCIKSALDAPPMRAPGVCRVAAGTKTAAADGTLCSYVVDMTPALVLAPSKSDSKITEAREKVLEILTSDNACTEWFESKAAQPGRTFQTLGVEVDRQGPHSIFETSMNGGMLIFRQPYVARATQDGGAFTTITINAHGAFYRSQTTVQKTDADGGTYRVDGQRPLTVGKYFGDTLAARMVTLLHEFGHVIDLLPQDGDDLDGSSIRNTNEVLHHCRSDVDARAKEAKLTKTHRPL